MSNEKTAPKRQNVSREDFVLACLKSQSLKEVSESLGIKVTSAQQRYHKMRKEGVGIPDRPVYLKNNHVETLNEMIKKFAEEETGENIETVTPEDLEQVPQTEQADA